MYVEKEIALPCEDYEKLATIYEDPEVKAKAAILYFHGGGLLYGNRKDLPQKHLDVMTAAGYRIIAYDYPLAPAADLNLIYEDVCASIWHYIEHPETYGDNPLPYFLWGRSAGAYLCLLAAGQGTFSQNPKGILSYYGYGFLCDGWFQTPSPYYNTLPAVPTSCLAAVEQNLHCEGDLETHYSIYVYARQTGKWSSFFYKGREKYFYLDYTLRACDTLPCPLFAAHSTGDTDVPYQEFVELCAKYGAKQYVAAGDVHDFDREDGSYTTKRLLDETLAFMQKQV